MPSTADPHVDTVLVDGRIVIKTAAHHDDEEVVFKRAKGGGNVLAAASPRKQRFLDLEGSFGPPLPSRRLLHDCQFTPEPESLPLGWGIPLA